MNNTLSALNQCVRKSLIPMNELIFLGISATLTIVFILVELITEQNSTKNQPSSKTTNKNVQSKKNDSIETNGRKSSNRRPPSNTEPQNQEEKPLIDRSQTDGATQLSDSTTQLSDEIAQLPNRTTQPPNGTARLPASTTQPSDLPTLSSTTDPPARKRSISSI